ncbi:hypothetical protein Golomagni_05742, partial [Golovinomyces magnicellulatus]
IVGDVHELVTFFVIEAQRILFAENVFASAAACVAAFFSYFLVKLVPYWGLAIIGTTIAFAVPLIYTTNQELIDEQIKNASEVLNAQTAQVRDLAQKQADHFTALGKQYAGDYTGKVQEMLRGRGGPPPVPSQAASSQKAAPSFPTPPTEEPAAETIPNIPDAPRDEPITA